MLPNPVMTVEEPPLSDEVREFCERHVLFGHLAKFLELVREFFTIVGEPVIEWDHDPENDDEYLVIKIQVQGDVSECVQAKWRFGAAWTRVANFPEIRLIRLFIDIV